MIDKADYALASAAITGPIWMQNIEPWITEYVLIGGGALLTIRIIIALRELWRGR